MRPWSQLHWTRAELPAIQEHCGIVAPISPRTEGGHPIAGLSLARRRIIADTKNIVVVSAASAWEIAIEVRLGKLPTAASLMSDFCCQMEREGFDLLAISAEHGVRGGLLPGPHRDPFDRMLIAQAQAENIPVITNERAFDSYGVRRLW